MQFDDAPLILDLLSSYTLTVEQLKVRVQALNLQDIPSLQATRLGAQLNDFRKSIDDKDVAAACKNLIKHWKKHAEGNDAGIIPPMKKQHTKAQSSPKEREVKSRGESLYNRCPAGHVCRRIIASGSLFI